MRKRFVQRLAGGIAALMVGVNLAFGGWHAPAIGAGAPPQANSNPGTGGSGTGGG